MLKKEIQQQLETIEETASNYFDKVETYEHPDDFSSLDPDDRAGSSELYKQIAGVVGQLSDVAEHSLLFDELDQQTLRDALRKTQAALHLRKYQSWDTHVLHDEDIILGVTKAGHGEYPTSVSEARMEFKEALEAVKQILIRVPDDAHEKATKESGVHTAPENSTTNLDLQQKEHLRVYEAAKIAGVSTRQIARWADKKYFPVRWNKKPKGEGRRILVIPGEPFREFLKGKITGHS